MNYSSKEVIFFEMEGASSIILRVDIRYEDMARCPLCGEPAVPAEVVKGLTCKKKHTEHMRCRFEEELLRNGTKDDEAGEWDLTFRFFY